MELTGYSRPDLPSLHRWVELAHGDDANRILAVIGQTYGRERREAGTEESVRCKDGSSRIWVFSSVGLGLDSSGRRMAITMAFDITDLRRVSLQLATQERHVREILALLPVGVWWVDERGKPLLVNDAAIRIWGGKREVPIEQYGEYTGWHADTGLRLEPGDWAAARAIEKAETCVEEELIIQCFDGPQKYILNSAIPLTDEDGRVRGAVIVNQDVTQRRKQQDELRQSESELRAIFELASVGIVQTDPTTGAILRFNEKYKQLTGYERDELLALPEWRLTHPEDLEKDWQTSPPVIEGTTRSRRHEKRYVRKDGSYVWVRVNAALIPDQQGTPVITVAVCEDITEERAAAQRMAEWNRELEERVRDRTSALEAANRELESFSYSVSHDLRAPLRAVSGFTRMLLEDHGAQLDQDAKRLCRVISDSARDMGRLIDDLLSLSRVGRAELHVSDVDMHGLARAVFHELCVPDQPETVRFLLDAIPGALGDASLLRQVWRNLLSNALKFSARRAQPVIRVTSTVAGGETIYIVEDNGAGFDMRYANKLFGVFQRLHSAREFEGTGVGLAIVQRIVQRHQGRIWAEASPDQGARFHFTLNCRRPS